ncbi:MAG: GTPase [Planctomycetes bacterium]|nr:GTPase [Planctomycetota bacterium]MBI3848527.1 GTPase [Planctomycetota bacterium]
MVQINFARKEINCKIVYYGPGMSGKTTNLEIIHKKTPDENKGELTCIATEGDRTLFFDFMPLNLGNIMGMNTKFQLYTVPGQVYYNSTRKLVLRGADGIIFVADSAPDKMDENLESLRNLEENLREYGRDAQDMPIVIQFNKRDLPEAVPLGELQEKLNPRKIPTFEAVAKSGDGVFQTLKALAGLVIENLNRTTRKEKGTRATESLEPAPGSGRRIVTADSPPEVESSGQSGGGRIPARRPIPVSATANAEAPVNSPARRRGVAGRPALQQDAVRSSGANAGAERAELTAPVRVPSPRVSPAPDRKISRDLSAAPRRGMTVLLVVLGIVVAAAAVFFVSRG